MKRLKDTIKRSSILFIIGAIFLHIVSFMKQRITCKTINSKTNETPVQSIHDAIQRLIKSSLHIYGKEKISDCEDGKKRMLFVSHDLNLTGAPIVLFRFAEIMKKKGWNVFFVSPLDGKLGLYAGNHGIPTFVIPDIKETDLVKQIHTVFEVIVINTIVLVNIVKQFSKTERKIIWWIHEAAASYGVRAAKEMPFRIADNIHIYCASEFAQEILRKRFPLYKSKLVYFYSPDLLMKSEKKDDDSERFMEMFPQKNCIKTFALIGTICYRKGQDIMVQAIRQMPKETRDRCRFIFIGSTVKESVLIESEIETCKKDYPGCVLYFDEFNMDDLYKFYRNIDFFISASREEPMGGVIAEGMSLGKPSICSTKTGISRIVGKYNAGYVYETNDQRELIKKIDDASRISKEDYYLMSQNARLAYENTFSTEIFEKNISEIINQVLSDDQSNPA